MPSAQHGAPHALSGALRRGRTRLACRLSVRLTIVSRASGGRLKRGTLGGKCRNSAGSVNPAVSKQCQN